MNAIAESYVRLVLALGRHDADFVDSYYGPPAWKEEAGRATRPVPGIHAEADALLAKLSHIPEPEEEMERLRHRYLVKQLSALRARSEMLSGRKFSFDEEARALYDWSGYNWYQGGFHSLIQVNTDLPVYIDRAVDLACHEGYPGHHVYNVLIEKNLVRDRGWVEFTVYPLFSPQSLIAEGSANFGIEVAFPGPERTRFETEVLYPLAGLDPTRAAKYAEVQRLADRLSYAGNEAARRYLNGEIDAKQAADWLEEYGLMARPRAEQRVRFIDQYRSYVINYNLGKDLVRKWIEGQGGTADQPERRWKAFAKLLSSPRLPSDLQSGR
ncbi:MAG: hypothetical protein LC780_01545 [Acidobacteria bacterium]|nr:hypothetical protein [Acidobacteriota bacterium]